MLISDFLNSSLDSASPRSSLWRDGRLFFSFFLFNLSYGSREEARYTIYYLLELLPVHLMKAYGSFLPYDTLEDGRKAQNGRLHRGLTD